MEDDMMNETGDYCIEITISGGNISVSSEPVEPEEEGEKKGTPVTSIGEAVKMVMDIYENGGDMGASEEDFNAGYGNPIREGE